MCQLTLPGDANPKTLRWLLRGNLLGLRKLVLSSSKGGSGVILSRMVLRARSWTKIRELNLSGDFFFRLTNGIELMVGLRTLKVRFTELKKLPLGIGQLTGLQRLDVSDCYALEEVGEIGGMVGLRHLNLRA
jgi:Leucine-rich repeat (LRR) protein